MMAQMTEDFAARIVEAGKRGEHSPLTAWEESQLAHGWLEWRCAQPRAVPDGWVLVPRELTDRMLDRAVAFALNVEVGGGYGWSDYMRDVWARMLAAAPQPGEPQNTALADTQRAIIEAAERRGYERGITERPTQDAEAKHVCVWSEDNEGNWDTGCGNLFVITEGTPSENDFGFCCYCGHKLEQVTQADAAMAREGE